MEALAYARLGLSQALTRHERASASLIQSLSGQSVQGQSRVEPIAAIAGQLEAKHQFRAALITALIADEMMNDLLEIQAKR